MQEKLNLIIEAVNLLCEQYVSDMEAIRHELEILWEAINELQGIDPEKAGEPEK